MVNTGRILSRREASSKPGVWVLWVRLDDEAGHVFEEWLRAEAWQIHPSFWRAPNLQSPPQHISKHSDAQWRSEKLVAPISLITPLSNPVSPSFHFRRLVNRSLRRFIFFVEIFVLSNVSQLELVRLKRRHRGLNYRRNARSAAWSGRFVCSPPAPLVTHRAWVQHVNTLSPSYPLAQGASCQAPGAVSDLHYQRLARYMLSGWVVKSVLRFAWNLIC